MKKTMNRACYFFLVLVFFTITLGIAKEQTTSSSSFTAIDQLPDEDTTYLNSILSALGGFSGGGLLLIFLLRRLVNSYDDTFAKWETRCSNHGTKQDEKNDKIILMIEEVQGTTQDLKMEIIKLQVNAIDKDTVTKSLTKVNMLETDIEQVRGDVKSIMTHLLNKPRLSGINNIRS
jgi:hypothetical protein